MGDQVVLPDLEAEGLSARCGAGTPWPPIDPRRRARGRSRASSSRTSSNSTPPGREPEVAAEGRALPFVSGSPRFLAASAPSGATAPPARSGRWARVDQVGSPPRRYDPAQARPLDVEPAEAGHVEVAVLVVQLDQRSRRGRRPGQLEAIVAGRPWAGSGEDGQWMALTCSVANVERLDERRRIASGPCRPGPSRSASPATNPPSASVSMGSGAVRQPGRVRGGRGVRRHRTASPGRPARGGRSGASRGLAGGVSGRCRMRVSPRSRYRS